MSWFKKKLSQKNLIKNATEEEREKLFASQPKNSLEFSFNQNPESTEKTLNQETKCQRCCRGLYCKPCNSVIWGNNFQNWTSDDANIDSLIQASQLDANNAWKLLEWIEYSNFIDIESVPEEWFGCTYKATWKDGPITYKCDKGKNRYWDVERSEWGRQGETLVAIKKYPDGMDARSDLLNEVTKRLSYKKPK